MRNFLLNIWKPANMLYSVIDYHLLCILHIYFSEVNRDASLRNYQNLFK